MKDPLEDNVNYNNDCYYSYDNKLVCCFISQI